MRAETEHKIVLDYEDLARANLGYYEGNMEAKIEITLNWWADC